MSHSNPLKDMFDLLCFLNKFNSNDLLWNTTRVCVLFAFYLLKTGEQRLLIRVSGRETPRSTIKTFIKVLKKHTESMDNQILLVIYTYLNDMYKSVKERKEHGNHAWNAIIHAYTMHADFIE